MHKSSFLNILLAGIFTLMLSMASFAQDGDDPPGGGDGGDPDANIPLDGGISLLLAAGAAYGAKKVYDRRKEEE